MRCNAWNSRKKQNSAQCGNGSRNGLMDFIVTSVGSQLKKEACANDMPTILTPKDFKKIKNMSINQLQEYLLNLYVRAYEAGLREGEKEFADAIIMTEDEAREAIGDEQYGRLTGWTGKTY